MNKLLGSERLEYPFASEFVTNRSGRIAKVVINLRDYRALIDAVEDAGLYRAMKRVAKEKPFDRETALALLDAK